MNLSELTARMAEAHRPVRRPDPLARLAGGEQYTVQCRVCHGDRVWIWRLAGEPEVTCELWRAAVALGVVTP